MTFEEWKEKYLKDNSNLAADMLDDGIDPGEVEWFLEDSAKKEYQKFINQQEK